MSGKLLKLIILAAAATLLATGSNPAAAQDKKLVIAVPGVPPIFATVIAFVAEKEGLFKKYGANVDIRPFDNGTAAARAVIAGDIDMALSPTPPVINQASNSDAPFVAVFGMPNPDWVLGSTEAGKTCKDIAGKSVGVDSIGGARSIALRSMLAGCPGVKIDQVQQVALGSNTAPAMIAGQLQFGVLHLDDLAVMEVQGKPVHILLAMKNTNPTSHYLIWVVRKDKLAANRDAIVRVVAALVAAARYMNDPENVDKVAEIATVTGHKKDVAKAALKQFLAI